MSRTAATAPARRLAPALGRGLRPPWGSRQAWPGCIVHQFRYDLRAFLRNRQATLFTLALPVIFLVIFASVFGGRGRTVQVAGGTMNTAAYYVPGIIALAIIAASFVNLVGWIATQREAGVLKRRRATPVSTSVVIAGRAMLAIVLAISMAALLTAIGWAGYDAELPLRALPALILAVLAGALCFCCIAYALASLVPNADAAQPLSQLVILPLYFISGVFVPTASLPHALVDVAAVFPVRHLQAAVLAAFNPHSPLAGFAWEDLAWLALWAAAGLAVSLLRFSWLPAAAGRD